MGPSLFLVQSEVQKTMLNGAGKYSAMSNTRRVLGRTRLGRWHGLVTSEADQMTAPE
jgi:hypothetical protein